MQQSPGYSVHARSETQALRSTWPSSAPPPGSPYTPPPRLRPGSPGERPASPSRPWSRARGESPSQAPSRPRSASPPRLATAEREAAQEARRAALGLPARAASPQPRCASPTGAGATCIRRLAGGEELGASGRVSDAFEVRVRALASLVPPLTAVPPVLLSLTPAPPRPAPPRRRWSLTRRGWRGRAGTRWLLDRGAPRRALHTASHWPSPPPPPRACVRSCAPTRRSARALSLRASARGARARRPPLPPPSAPMQTRTAGAPSWSTL